MRSHILLAAAATASLGLALVASPAAAHGGGHGAGHHTRMAGYDAHCASSKATARTIGGTIGAIGGAAAGRALAASPVRPEGVILGAIVGAVVGAGVGNANVDCGPTHRYTQDGGRSYGAYVQPQAQVYTQSYGQSYGYQTAPPVVASYQPPVAYQEPVYQPPVSYQAPVYQQPVYQQPVYQQPVHQQPVYQQGGHAQVVAGEDWYQPSPQSYYGQERRGPLVAAPPPYGRPDVVPMDNYVSRGQTMVYTQQSGSVQYYAPPAPLPAPLQGAPACGYYVCGR